MYEECKSLERTCWTSGRSHIPDEILLFMCSDSFAKCSHLLLEAYDEPVIDADKINFALKMVESSKNYFWIFARFFN